MRLMLLLLQIQLKFNCKTLKRANYTTSKMLSYDKEEIIKVANEELKKYHNDKNYETEIDSNSVINTTQQFLLTQGNNTKLLK